MAQNKTPLTSEELNRRNIGAASMAGEGRRGQKLEDAGY